MCKCFFATIKILSAACLLALSNGHGTTTAQAQQTAPASNQAPKPTPTPTAIENLPAAQNKLVIETQLVNLTVTVTDSFGRFVTGLEKENFSVFDDKVQQEVAFFATDDAPISLGIVYDVSYSMKPFTMGQVA